MHWKFSKKNIEFTATFVGGWGDILPEQFQMKLKEKGLNKHVTYEGKKYDHEKWQYFLNADIFVFPTFYRNETFGIVNLEAMQFELPIISTFEGGIPDIIDDKITGYLCKQKDEIELSEKLITMISNPELRKSMGSAGRKKFETEFTLDIFEKRIYTILSSLIN